MHGNLQAITLIAIVVMTIAVVKKHARKVVLPRHVISAVIIGPGLGLIAVIFSLHGCNAGQPLTQWLIPALCLSVLILTVGNRDILWTTGIVLTASMLLLCFHYAGLVHEPGYTGNPSIYEADQAIGEDLANQNTRILRELAEEDGLNYPEGWFSQSALAQNYPSLAEFLETGYSKLEVRMFWHSLLTKIFYVERVEMEVWYSGGKVAVGTLEYREVPPSP